jgi:phosphoglycolate phosphatase-like HAD superfamily hydrolase
MSGQGSWSSLDAVAFDLDGTLINSMDAYTRILKIAFNQMGLKEDARQLVLSAMREGGFDWDSLFPAYEGEQRQTLMKEARAVITGVYLRTFRQEVKLIPGAAQVLADMPGMGLKPALVTATHMKFLEDKLHPLKQAGVGGVFQAVVTLDDVPRGKPSPDPLVECAKRLSVGLEKMLYVGDTCADIRAGKAAGTLTAGVLTGADDYASLKAEEPDALLESVADLPKLLAQQRG